MAEAVAALPTSATVITVTLHPALDETVELAELRPGALHRCPEVRRRAGGKGLNVATALAKAGVQVVATGFLGRDNEAPFVEHCRRGGIVEAFVRLPGLTRSAWKIVERPSGRVTEINGTGPAPNDAAWTELLGTVQQAVRQGALWLVLAGSAPPGASVGDIAAFLRLARGLGLSLAVDTSGPLLQEVVREGLADLLKPNRDELAELCAPDPAPTTAAALADWRQRWSVPTVLASRGADGVWLATAAGCWALPAPVVPVRQTVGAGDALLAGWLAAVLDGAAAPIALAAAQAAAIAHLSAEPAP